MKILVCVQEYYPSGSGIGNITYHLVEEFKKQGHECTVLSSGEGDINLPFQQRIQKLAGIGILLFWNKVRQILHEQGDNYDVIWVHNPLFLRHLKTTTPIFSTVHTTYVKRTELYGNSFSLFEKIYYQFMKKIEQHCYKRNVFQTSTTSASTISELTQLHISNPIYIPNGVDTKRFTPKKKTRKKTIICVGRIAHQKNPFQLVQLMHEVHTVDKTITFEWVGDGSLETALKKYVAKHHLQGIRLRGRVAHKNIQKAYQENMAFILLSTYEGQPLALLEAISSGCSPIISNLQNMVSVLKPIKAGLIVNQNSAAEIVKYMNSKRIHLDSATCSTYAKKHLDWSRIAKKYQKWLNSFEK